MSRYEYENKFEILVIRKQVRDSSEKAYHINIHVAHLYHPRHSGHVENPAPLRYAILALTWIYYLKNWQKKAKIVKKNVVPVAAQP